MLCKRPRRLLAFGWFGVGLRFVPAELAKQKVFPDSATRRSYRTVEAMLEFKLWPDGPAKRVILHQNGYRQSAIRIEK